MKCENKLGRFYRQRSIQSNTNKLIQIQTIYTNDTCRYLQTNCIFTEEEKNIVTRGCCRFVIENSQKHRYVYIYTNIKKQFIKCISTSGFECAQNNEFFSREKLLNKYYYHTFLIKKPIVSKLFDNNMMF